MQRAAGGGEGVYFFSGFGVFDQGRSVVRFCAGVYDQWTGASPMFEAGEAADAVDIVGGVGAGEGDPEEIIQVGGGEFAVVR